MVVVAEVPSCKVSAAGVAAILDADSPEQGHKRLKSVKVRQGRLKTDDVPYCYLV